MIPPIGSLPSVATSGAAGVTGTGGASSVAGASGASGGGSSFGNVITDALNSVQQTQATASSKAAEVAAGQGSIADAMVASSEASMATQVTTAITNKAIDAFTSIMNMQV